MTPRWPFVAFGVAALAAGCEGSAPSPAAAPKPVKWIDRHQTAPQSCAPCLAAFLPTLRKFEAVPARRTLCPVAP